MLVTTVSKQNTFTNRIYFNKIDVQKFNGIYIKVRSETNEYIFLFDIDNEIQPGHIGLSNIHIEKFDFKDFHSCDNIGDIQIKKYHFERAIQESIPVFGIDEDDIYKYIPRKIVQYNDDYKLVQHELLLCFKQLIYSQFSNTLSVLVHGPLGCGKTAMVVNMSVQSNVSYIKIINQYGRL